MPPPVVRFGTPLAQGPVGLALTAAAALSRGPAHRALALPLPLRTTAGTLREPFGPIPFSGSKPSPRFWSVRRSMGNDHERPSVKVLPLSVLGAGQLLWCVFTENRETDERLEAVLFGQIVDSDTRTEHGSAAAVRELTKVCWHSAF
uniref:Uncharacterized protein n=1 Tax=Geospiza parvula TaxID=87175 RepID=A0A8C3N5L2_GEOPR